GSRPASRTSSTRTDPRAHAVLARNRRVPARGGAGRELGTAGLSPSGSHEELKPDQPFVKLAKRPAMPVVVQPHTLEQRTVEVLERPEVIAVSGRDFSDQGSRLARPRVDAP